MARPRMKTGSMPRRPSAAGARGRGLGAALAFGRTRRLAQKAAAPAYAGRDAPGRASVEVRYGLQNQSGDDEARRAEDSYPAVARRAESLYGTFAEGHRGGIGEGNQCSYFHGEQGEREHRDQEMRRQDEGQEGEDRGQGEGEENGPGLLARSLRLPSRSGAASPATSKSPEQETYGRGTVAEALHEYLQIGRRDAVDREENEVDQTEAEIGHAMFHVRDARSLYVSLIGWAPAKCRRILQELPENSDIRVRALKARHRSRGPERRSRGSRAARGA